MAWRPSEVGKPPPGHLWRWELEPSDRRAHPGHLHVRLDPADRSGRFAAGPGDHGRAAPGLARPARRAGRKGSGRVTRRPAARARFPAGRSPVSTTVSGRPNLRRDALRFRLQFRGPVLGEPDHPAVVAEVVGPQLRVPVQAEPGQHGPVEAAHQEVGQQVRARLGLEELAHPVRAGEHVVAVQARQPPQAQPGAQVVERAVGAAVGVGHRHAMPVSQGVGGHPFGPWGDLLRDGCAAARAGYAPPPATGGAR